MNETLRLSDHVREVDLQNAGLIVRGIGKVFRKRPVVRNVSLTLRRGEAIGLLGPNGAGKTTTFYMIVGLIQPDTGTIMLDGADISMLPMYRRARLGIGYLPQEASVFRGLTVEQNIAAAIEVVEYDRDRRAALLDELLAEFGMEDDMPMGDHLTQLSTKALRMSLLLLRPTHARIGLKSFKISN